MWNKPQADAVDRRIVIRVYAWMVCAAGLLLAGWGPMWLGTDMKGVPHGKAALIRMMAAAMILTGCFGAALAEVREPRAVKRGLIWFLGAQVVAFGLLRVQVEAVFGREELTRWMVLLMGLLYLLVWLVVTAEGVFRAETWKPQTLFGAPEERELRSKYEEQIRAAAAQEERHRLARELHDSIKQQIFVAQTAAATAEARFGSDEEGTRAALGEVRQAARAAMTEMEAMLEQLRAARLENAGLIGAVKEQCEALGIRAGADVVFEAEAMPKSEDMPPGSQQAMYRVAQEALANVARHARAGKVEVRLERIGNEVRLRVADDGAGFDANRAARGMGLENMRARAEEHGGVLEVVSNPGAGTVVELRIPCAPGMDGEAERHLKFALVWVASAAIMGGLVFALGHWTVMNVGLLGVAVVGYVRKDAEPETLLAAVRAVSRGKSYFDVPATGVEEELTAREREVLRLVALGRSNKEIADELGIGDETVKTHVTNVLGKLMAENRAQAVVQALKRGLVALEELE